MTLEEQREGAISGRAWKAWEKPAPGRPPQRREDDPEKERLRKDLEDIRAANAKLAAALRNMKERNERLRIICRAVLESAFGEDWEEKLREVQQVGTDHDDQQGDAGAPAGE